MRTARPALIVVTLALLSGCMLVPPHGGYMPPPPEPAYRVVPPPPRPARLLSEGEAVDVALRYAASRGLDRVRVKHAHLDGDGRWHVDLRGDRGHDRAKLLIDARTGEVLRANLREDD
jgi:hypothetical protein